MIFFHSPSKNLIKICRLTYFGITFLFLGCVNYSGINSTKKIASPAQFDTQKTLTDQHGRWPDHYWVREFSDPQLLFLIQEALANNPDLAAAKARIVQAKAMVGTKYAALSPSVNLQSQITKIRVSENLLPPSLGGGHWFTFSTLLFRLNYEIDFWGKNLAALRQAVAEERVVDVANQEARLTIAVSVATTYNQLAYYYALRDILRRTVQQREALNKITKVRLNSGLDTRVQLYQSHNTVATARTQLLATENAIEITKQQLGTLVGMGPDRGSCIKRPQLAVLKTPRLPDNLAFNLLGRRPDIVGARWRVEAYCQGIENVKAQFYPNINLAAVAGLISLHLNTLFESASQQYQIGPALNLPIFDADALRSKLREQYGYYEEAVANYDSTLNNALAEVANGITSIRSLDQQVVSQREALTAALKAYNLAAHQYQIGLTSQLVVLDAETRLLEEQQAQLRLISDRRNLQIVLMKALGGGFQQVKIMKCC